MSFLSSLENLVQRVEAPFKKPVSEIENFFKSLGSEVFDEENKILQEIGKEFSKLAAPLTQGIATFFTVENAEKIISNPLNNSITESFTRRLEKDIIPSIPSFINPKKITALNSAGSKPATFTFTPSFELGIPNEKSDIGNTSSASSSFDASPPHLNESSIEGGLDFNFSTHGSLSMTIGLNLKIDIPERGTFQIPSYGIMGPGSKESLGQFQGSEGVISVSGGIGFGGTITNDSDDSISLDLDLSLLCLPTFKFQAQIEDRFSVSETSIKQIYGTIVEGRPISEIVEDLSLQPNFKSKSEGSITVGFTPTLKGEITRQSNGMTLVDNIYDLKGFSESNEINGRDFLTGLEIELDVNPALTASIGLILEEENTGVTLTALNMPFSLENKITLGFDNNSEKFEIYDDVSADIGVNLQALGASVYKTFSLPGFVWDLGSLDEKIGKVDFLHLNSEGIGELISPSVDWVPSGKFSFDGIELASTNF